MKVLFVGSNGWVGSLILKEWKNVRPDDSIVESTVRINTENYSLLEKELDDVKPDRVICTLGRVSGSSVNDPAVMINNIDYLEQKGKLSENINDNLYAPLILAALCSSRGIHMTYVGTGCIFSENTRELYVEHLEEDCPNFFGSQYSVVKGYTDQLMKLYPTVLNLRIRMPIMNDWNPKNFVSKIVGFNKICSYPNAMTYLPNLIPVLVDLSAREVSGTLNFVNPGAISHAEILDMYKKYIDPMHTYTLVEFSDLKGTCVNSDRSNNRLSTTRIESVTSIPLKPIKQCIKDWFKSILMI
jgi:dTDP-4-dehydrorhamnose reductase